MSVTYSCMTFNTVHKTEGQIFGYENTIFYEVLDALFVSFYTTFNQMYGFRAPKNLLIAFDGKRFRVFVGNEKAIVELNNINTYTKVSDKLPTLNSANDIGIKDLGYRFDLYFDFNKEFIDESQEYINKLFDSYSDSDKRAETIIGNIRNFEKGSESISNSQQYFMQHLDEIYHSLREGLIKMGNVMEFNPRFKARNIVVNPNQCFYVMDFHDPIVKDAKSAIDKKLEEKLGVSVIKSEDLFDPNRNNDIVENIWQDIMTSKFIIADLSIRNPNVYYELGICDTIGKSVIPICNNKLFKKEYSNGLPFDISKENTIFYGERYIDMDQMAEMVYKKAKAIVSGKIINMNK